jgi:hypothetical protein
MAARCPSGSPSIRDQRRASAVAVLTMQGRASALKLSTSYGNGETDLIVEAGVVGVDAETTSGSTASGSAPGAYAR